MTRTVQGMNHRRCSLKLQLAPFLWAVYRKKSSYNIMIHALGSESWNPLKTESNRGYHSELHTCSKDQERKFKDVTRDGAEPTPRGQREKVCTDPDNELFLGEGKEWSS